MRYPAALVVLTTLALAVPVQAQGTGRAIQLDPPTTAQQVLFHGGVGAYIMAGIHDGRQTKLLLDNSDGGIAEGNPIPAFLIDRFGTTTFEAWKIGMTFAVAAGLEYLWTTIDDPRWRWALVATSIGMAVFQGVVIESNLQVAVLGTSFLF